MNPQDGSGKAPIPFNQPHLVGNELQAIEQMLLAGKHSGDGPIMRSCQNWFVERLGSKASLMTPSCSLALDMAMLLCNLEPGDEVLIPDFTFVSTAQCIAMRGAVPVFCDIRPDTLNLDEARLEEALTPKTKAIIPVHYAGVSAEMDFICAFAARNNLLVVEDAAQAIGATYHGRPVGSLGDMAAFSFHETKNIHCGEGGMLAINNPKFVDPAYIAWEKGTDRRNFREGRVEKYQWKALGSSFLASEMAAAFLSVQLDAAHSINESRLAIWSRYQAALKPLGEMEKLGLPNVPENVFHNGHLFYLILPSSDARSRFTAHMHERAILTPFHYVALHQSDGGKTYGREGMKLRHSTDLSNRLVRLPLYANLSIEDQNRVIEAVFNFFGKNA